jgi:hypothetical protein
MASKNHTKIFKFKQTGMHPSGGPVKATDRMGHGNIQNALGLSGAVGGVRDNCGFMNTEGEEKNPLIQMDSVVDIEGV